MSKRKFLIDTDTASDDAVALLMALRSPDVDVLAITEVMGNVDVQQGSINARYTVELCGKSTPVHIGCAQPLYRKPVFAHWYHGPDGMGGMNYPAPRAPVADGHAVDVIIELVKAHPGEITLVTLGPLTNVAVALRIEPRLAGWVRRCVVMGGTGVLPGNVTALAEYNAWADPEAARIVFDSGMHLEMVGWDVSRQDAVVDDGLAAELRGLGPLGRYAVDIQRTVREYCRTQTGLDGFDLPDPIAMCVAIDDAIVTKEETRYVEVVLGEGHARGQTMVDWLGVTKKPANCRVVLRADQAKFHSMLRAALRG